jgi:Fic family protein
MPTYIHELQDWPGFQWDKALIAQRLAPVRHLQGRLIGRMEALGFPLRTEAVLATLTEDVLKSSEIEGEQLNRDQVRSSIARRLGLEIGGLTPADRHVEGVVEMMLDATQNYSAALNAERLFAWHAALFPTGRSGMTKIVVGGWRDDASGPMQVVSGAVGKERVHYKAPPAKRLKTEMAAFLKWFEAKEALDPVLKAALAHLWFVAIHPFDDGNGRIARDCRYGACPFRSQSAALLQHVGANPHRAQSVLRHLGKNPEGRSRHHGVAGMVPCLS